MDNLKKKKNQKNGGISFWTFITSITITKKIKNMVQHSTSIAIVKPTVFNQFYNFFHNFDHIFENIDIFVNFFLFFIVLSYFEPTTKT